MHQPKSRLSRRKFIQAGGAAATAFTIVPRHVLGGPGFVPPSENGTRQATSPIVVPIKASLVRSMRFSCRPSGGVTP